VNRQRCNQLQPADRPRMQPHNQLREAMYNENEGGLWRHDRRDGVGPYAMRHLDVTGADSQNLP